MSASGYSNLSGVYLALDLDKLHESNFIDGKNGKAIRFDQLPAISVDIASIPVKEMCVLSWRWDIDTDTNASRNVYIACQEAKKQGVRYFFLDKISINQQLSDADMLVVRLEFSRLYSLLPVIAAYDHIAPGYEAPTAEVHGETLVLGLELARIMRRPWLFQEIQLFANNPLQVTYVGYIPDLGCSESRSFIDLADAVWRSGLCQTILYTLTGTVGMHYVEDFKYIMPQYFDLLSAAHTSMSKSDYLLTAALLAGKANSRINNDQQIPTGSFNRYRIGEGYAPDDLPKTQDYYTRYDIYLDDRIVGHWQTRHKIYPFAELRTWFEVYANAEAVICDLLGKKINAVDKAYMPVNSDQQKRPSLALVFHEKDEL